MVAASRHRCLDGLLHGTLTEEHSPTPSHRHAFEAEEDVLGCGHVLVRLRVVVPHLLNVDVANPLRPLTSKPHGQRLVAELVEAALQVEAGSVERH